MTESKKKTTSTSTKSKKEPSKFTVDEILANAEVFGSPSYVIAGALHKKGDAFTKSEVDQHIKEFLKRGVK